MRNFKSFFAAAVSMAVLALSGPVLAAAPADQYAGQIQLTPKIPEKGPDATSALPTNLPSPEQLLAEQAQRDRAAQAAARSTAAAAAAAAGVDPNLPKVPASEPGTAGPAQGDANFVVGQPVPTFPTMEAAAAAGVDPYRVKGAMGIPRAGSTDMDAFDWTSLDSYLDWLAAHETNGLIVLGGAVFAILAGVSLVLRRKLRD